MRIIRYQSGSQDPQYGWLLDDFAGPIQGSPFGVFQRNPAELELAQIKLLAPVIPGKIICVGRNYVAHAREQKADVPEYPLIFLKPPSSLIGPGESILLPPQSAQVEHEAELVIVISKRGRWIAPSDAASHILGYTIANDVTARDLQYKDGQWTRAKGFDTFCPLGPWIETEFSPTDALITCKVNGQTRQLGSTRDMVFSVAQLIAYTSSIMTLEPGDIILTGTPAGVGPLQAGDEISVEIDGLGILSNPVKAAQTR